MIMMILSLFNLRKIVSWVPVQCELANGDQREVGMGPDLPKTVFNFTQFHFKKIKINFRISDLLTN